jgi:D-tagatose-1,6-bisphosphate aldolase subunit GatZ/KbaZ
MIKPLGALLNRHRVDPACGVYAVCTAHPVVIRAALRQARQEESMLLIESTSNQVDQTGGYTGMTPVHFAAMVYDLAEKEQVPVNRIILGGDHLGPNAWKEMNAQTAMDMTAAQLKAYREAGYTKYHLDASMACSDDECDASGKLPDDTIADRTAQMCKTVEDFSRNIGDGVVPHYVIGSDVPPPGGALHDIHNIAATTAEAVNNTIERTRQAFGRYGIEEAWQRVMAVVVQPGVEFSGEEVNDYNRQKAAGLSVYIEKSPNLVYEAHSTDYQLPELLSQMVQDHFAILKVGPGLTFAYREAVFALEMMERDFLAGKRSVTLSGLRQVIETVMRADPAHWRRHYTNDETLGVSIHFSYSDRVRYYWPHRDVQQALSGLLQNLYEHAVPLNLISQYFPAQYLKIRQGRLQNDANELIIDRISDILKVYSEATKMSGSYNCSGGASSEYYGAEIINMTGVNS